MMRRMLSWRRRRERVVDLASAARTIAELEVEIAILARLEELALQVRRSGTDLKWEGLASLLQNNAEMFDASRHRRKLVIFTEHRDTLNYLTERIALCGAERPLSISMMTYPAKSVDKRKKLLHRMKRPVLVATDAASRALTFSERT